MHTLRQNLIERFILYLIYTKFWKKELNKILFTSWQNICCNIRLYLYWPNSQLQHLAMLAKLFGPQLMNISRMLANLVRSLARCLPRFDAGHCANWAHPHLYRGHKHAPRRAHPGPRLSHDIDTLNLDTDSCHSHTQRVAKF